MMSITACSRGHLIEWDGLKWNYADTKEPLLDDRFCVKCGKMPTHEGYDACLGHIEGATSACCGHGIEKGYAILATGNK